MQSEDLMAIFHYNQLKSKQIFAKVVVQCLFYFGLLLP